jgi:hypothetical protein
MSSLQKISLFVCLLFCTVALHAQSVDATGHWEGVVHVSEMDVRIEVDLTKSAAGALAGTFSNVTSNVHHLPLSDVGLDGATVTFAIKAEGGGTFRGDVSGQSIRGTFTMRAPDGKSMELPFDLERKGDAQVAAVPTSAPITSRLEGRWSGSLVVEGNARDVGLKLLNHANGTSTGYVVTGEGIEIAITRIEQKDASVKLDVANVGGSYSGILNTDGTEIAGTWTQGAFSAPLTFRRSKASSSTGVNPIDRWAIAIGGRDKVAAVRSTYREGTIEAAGLQGVIRTWHTADGKYRKEEKIGALSTIETFDGTSGSVQHGDAPPHGMTEPELVLARSQAYANWSAVFFAFFPERRHGTASVDDDDIVLSPEGGIARHVSLDPETSLPKSMSHQRAAGSVRVDFVSWETIDGLQFEKEIRRTAPDPRFNAVIRFTKTVLNPPIEASMFQSMLASH